MVEALLETVVVELSKLCTENNDRTEQWSSWSTEQIVRLLQQYPAGISKPVMLTELEYKWYEYDRVGTLSEALTVFFSNHLQEAEYEDG
jgi:hypothetical protein